MTATLILAAAILLPGVRGSELHARAFFDANNVKVGDPMILTIDFIGEADFSSLHPPALARAVDRRDWKLDDASAKTDTFRDARRLTYRVRPMREGVLWFPSLTFEFEGPGGTRHRVIANEIPVHAKVGAQVNVAGMDEVDTGLPTPPDLVIAPGVALSDDRLFAWRKALAQPTEAAFAAFDFPAARLNEATCALRAGNWARALDVYRWLEWRIGQTPDIERGIVAALAMRHDNPTVELPMWRQVLRPILRHAWLGRIGLVVGGFAAIVLILWLLGRGIRALACLAVAFTLVFAANAQDIRQMMEQMERRHQQMMQQAFGGGFGFSFGSEEERKPVRIAANVMTSKKTLQVGDPFEFILTLEYPKSASVGQIQIAPSSNFGLTFTGAAQNLTDGTPSNPSNILKRLSVPARYDVPYRGRLSFTIEGMVSERGSRRGGMFSFSFQNSFSSKTPPIDIAVQPLPSAGQPADFSGIISEGLRVHETCDLLTVETNDVVTITYRLFPKGYVPDGYLPKGAAFEWMRQNDREGRPKEIEFRRYFVADGAPATPRLSISYYDPRTKRYRCAETGDTPLKYAEPK